MKTVLGGILLVSVVMLVFFTFGVLREQPNYFGLAIIALLVVLVISFLFTTVSAQAIATVGTNPVSGMTLMTLILASVILAAAGLTGNAGMLAALMIGGVVCTALSQRGSMGSPCWRNTRRMSGSDQPAAALFNRKL